VLGPDLGGVRLGRLVAVGGHRIARRRIQAEMGMVVDDPGRDELPAGVDDRGAGGHVDGGADRDDLALAHEHRAVRDDWPGRGQQRRVADGEGG
jgi:hypothetical protein